MTKIPADPSTKEIMPYTTSDTPFAAYLHYSGYKVVGSKQDPHDYKREVLVFILQDDTISLEDEWKLGKAQGDLKRFCRSLKFVNHYVKNARRDREN